MKDCSFVWGLGRDFPEDSSCLQIGLRVIGWKGQRRLLEIKQKVWIVIGQWFPGKGSCSYMFWFVYNVWVLPWANCMKSHPFYAVFRKFLGFRSKIVWRSWVYYQATHLFLPSFLGSSLNRLAVMNYHQAAWRCSGLFLCCLVHKSLWLLELVGVYRVWWLIL